MIGSIVRQYVSPEKPKVSTQLRELIVSEWTETRNAQIPSMKEREQIWKEFWLYASGTKQWCARKYVIAALSEGGSETNKAETLWNFNQGHALHEMFQNKILTSLGTRFLGSWERYVRSDNPELYSHETAGFQDRTNMPDNDNLLVEWGMVERPELIEGEEHNPWMYKETKVRLKKERIVIKFDGVIRWDDGLEIFELKSEKERARDTLDPMMGGKPRPHHIEQVMIAMYATGIRRARIVYLFKGANSLHNSLLEHVISYDEKLALELVGRATACTEGIKACDKLKDDNKVTELLSDTSKFNEWLDENYKRIEECPMKSKGVARYCGARDVCFPKGYRKKKCS